MANKMVVICVDDEETVLQSLELELANKLGDCILELAQSGEEALEICQEYKDKDYDIPVVICDYIMPNLKGDEVLKMINQALPHTHNIMLTGQADVSGVVRAINEARLYRYIAKPWEKEDLFLTITSAIDHYCQSREVEESYQAMEKFIPRELLREMGVKKLTHINFGDCIKKEMTVLFADIRSFTTLSEKMSPQKTFSFLNAYFELMGPIIRQHNGFINKFIGDGIMAVFPERPEDAVDSGIAMLEALSVFNESSGPDTPNINIGIGIHSGRVILGTVGEKNRMEATVIGDSVNVAARLEEMTKAVKSPLLISSHTWELIDEREKYLIRYLGPLDVRGKIMHIPLIEVYNADQLEMRTRKQERREEFRLAVKAFHEGDRERACGLFSAYQEADPEDTVVAFYLKRLR